MAETKTAEASELVRSLLSDVPSEVFSLYRVHENGSRSEYRLRVRLLRTEEHHEAIAEAQTYAKNRSKHDQDYGDLYREAQAVEVLTRALCNEKKRERKDGSTATDRAFVSSQQLRESFTESEMALCLNMYELVKAKFSCIEDFSEEAIDLWAARLSDTLMGPYFLVQLDSTHWPTLLMSLAQRVRFLSGALGLTLPDLRGSSESDPEKSDSGTSGSGASPTAALPESGKQIPSDRLLDRQQAREIAKELFSETDKGSADDDE